MRDTGSDEMIDIQIEESLVRETLMTIDSANSREDFLILGGFFCILVLTALTGIFGPPSVTLHHIARNLSNRSGPQQFNFQSASLSPLNRFISLSLIMVRREPYTANRVPVSFSFRMDCLKSGISTRTFSQSFYDVSTTFASSAANSSRIRLLSDRVVDYDSFELSLRFDGLPFSRVIVRTVAGVTDHTVFQIIFRIVFAVFAALFLLFLGIRLRPMPVSLWHLEQKLTVPLLVLDLLFSNPFFIIHSYIPSQGLIVLTTIIHSLFTSYFRFFVLVLFDSLRYKNRKTDHCFFVPKVAFVLLFFVIGVVHGVSDDVASFGDSPLERNHAESVFEKAETALYIVYLAWVVKCVAHSAAQVDVTERYKFCMYLAACGFSLFILGVLQIVFKAFNLFLLSSVPFAIVFAVQNVFVLLMAYFHWPYEMLHDQSYVDRAGDVSEHTPAEFLANMESDN
jgi:hypothetical protein